MKVHFKTTLYKLLALLLMLSLFVGCVCLNVLRGGTPEGDLSSCGGWTWGLTLDQLKFDLDIPGKEKTIAWADEIMEGRLYLDIDLQETVLYTTTDFDWNMERTQSPATFQLYLQALGMVKFLTYAALETGNPSYLERARWFVEDWWEYANDPEQNMGNPKLWYDHGASLRTETLIYFQLASEKLAVADNTLRDLIYQILVEHGKFLENEVTYVKNHNHGIFQDEALLYISVFLSDYPKSAEWRQLAKNRLQRQLEFAFTEEYVHVENSTGYCIGVIGLFYNSAELLRAIGDPYGEELHEQILKMTDFYARCILPAGYPLAVGDSFVGRGDNSEKPNYDNAFLEYVLSRGEKGKPPESLSAYYPASGYYFTQETYEKEDLRDATWTMFKAGYVSATHKHADDLSFLLYSKGYEIFIDPGMYNYMSGDMYRDYLVSASAHNTVSVDGMTYSTSVENSRKVGLLYHEDTAEYRYVLGFNDMYPGVEIDRHFYSMNDAIVLFDDIYSEEQHTYSQLFHLSEDMRIRQLDARETILELGESGYTVHIRQMGKLPKLRVLRGEGDIDGQIFGFASEQNNEIHAINTLKYDLPGEDSRFVTVITIEDKNGQVKLTNADAQKPQYVDAQQIRYSAETEELTMGQLKIGLTPRTHINICDIQTEIKGDVLSVQPKAAVPGMQYLWYLVDADSGKSIEQSEWDAEGKTQFILPEGAVLLKAYTRDAYGQRRDRIVAGWFNAGSGRHPMDAEGLNYRHMDDSITKIGKNTYRAKADQEYLLDHTIRWYIYRNGSYFTNITTVNEDQIDFELTEPGRYTISYYFRTILGEQEYWVMPELVLPG